MSSDLMHTGIVFPRETLKKLDERKGRYISRNKYILKIVEEHLNENENKENMPSGEQVTNQSPPAATDVVVVADDNNHHAKEIGVSE